MLWWFVQTSIVASGLALLVVAAGRLGRLRPATRHVLWVVVLARMMAPPVVEWPWPLPISGLMGGEPVSLPAVEPSSPRGLAFGSDDARPPVPRVEDGAETMAADPAGAERASFATPEADRAVSWPAIDAWRALAVGWLVATALVVAVQLGRIARFARRLRKARPAPETWSAEVARLAREAGVRPPRVEVLDGLDAPMLWCGGRPRLLVPGGMLDRLDPSGRRCVIAHELRHLARRDHWVSRLELVAGWAWWWSPLYWWVRRRLGVEAELACDAWVVRRFPGDRRSYAGALLDACQFRSSSPSPPPMLGIGGGPSQLIERRLRMILAEPIGRPATRRGLLAGVAIALLGLPALPSPVPDPGSARRDSPGGISGSSDSRPGDTTPVEGRHESPGAVRSTPPDPIGEMRPADVSSDPTETPGVDIIVPKGGDRTDGDVADRDAVAQGRPGGDPVLTYSDSRTIRIPFNLQGDEVAERIRDIHLYVSTAGGDKWRHAAAAIPDQRAFSYQAPRDGEFWFAVRTIDRDGQSHPGDGEPIESKLRVVVDTTPPKVVVRNLIRRGQDQRNLVDGIHREVQDEHPDLSTFALEYLDGTPVGGSQGRWRREEVEPRLVGERRWVVGSSPPRAARVTIEDRAGNRASAMAALGIPASPLQDPGGRESRQADKAPLAGIEAPPDDLIDSVLSQAWRMPTDAMEVVEIEQLLQDLRHRLHNNTRAIEILESARVSDPKRLGKIEALKAGRMSLGEQIRKVQDRLAVVQAEISRGDRRQGRGPAEVNAASLAREVFGPGHWATSPSFSYGTGNLRRFVYGDDSENLGRGRYRLSPAAMIILPGDGTRPGVITGEAAEVAFDRDPIRAFEEGVPPRLLSVRFQGPFKLVDDDVSLSGRDLLIEGEGRRP